MTMGLCAAIELIGSNFGFKATKSHLKARGWMQRLAVLHENFWYLKILISFSQKTCSNPGSESVSMEQRNEMKFSRLPCSCRTPF